MSNLDFFFFMEFPIYSPTEEKLCPNKYPPSIPEIMYLPISLGSSNMQGFAYLEEFKKKKKSMFSSASKGAILTYFWTPYTVLDFLKYQCKLIISLCLFSGFFFFWLSVIFLKNIPFHKDSFRTVKGLNNTKCNGKMLFFFFLCKGKTKKYFTGNVFL